MNEVDVARGNYGEEERGRERKGDNWPSENFKLTRNHLRATL